MNVQEIINNLPSLLNSDEFPLLNNTFIEGLENVKTSFSNEFSTISILNSLGDYDKFRNIISMDIVNLRILLHFEISNNNFHYWMEKLLRYCEINYVKLRSNERKYGRSRNESIEIYNQIIALFVEYHLNSKDLLFLNTALKLADLHWIKPILQTPNSIKVLRKIKMIQLQKILRALAHD